MPIYVKNPNLPTVSGGPDQLPGFVQRLVANLIGILTSYANAINANANLTPYDKADLPADAVEGQQAFVRDEAGGSVPAFFDGTDWRRVTDRAIVS